MDLGQQTAKFFETSLVVFRLESTAGLLFLALCTLCLILCAVYYVQSIALPMHALSRADEALRRVHFVDASDHRAVQRDAESRLDEAVRSAAKRTAAGYRLLIAWRRRLALMHAGMPSGEEPIVRATTVLGPQPRWLNTAANAVVSLGLIFTFLGLVAGLGAASEALSEQGDPRHALLGLLGAASVKFLTSIGGIGGAMVMRLWQAICLGRVAAKAQRLSEDLDAHLLALADEGQHA